MERPFFFQRGTQCFLQYGIKLERARDLDKLNMIENMQCGGLCFVGSNRYVKANNQHIPDYDKNKPSNYIIDDDADNLYCCSMSEVLPYEQPKFDNNIN